MPTFCRHNRFLERCPICSKDLPGSAPSSGRPPRSAGKRTRSHATEGRNRGARGQALRVHREGRAEDDGYRSELAPGVRASADARRLAQELAFASGRLLALGGDPPGLYGEARTLAASDLERASWICFLIAYLSPTEDTEDPFAAIRAVLERAPVGGELPDLGGVALGPRSSHEPARGAGTLIAYRQWVQRSGGPQATQAAAFAGDPAWTPQRRFERLFERLALPGLARTGRYELLVTLGRLGLYELRADSLQLAGARGALAAEDAATLAAKRVFGIGDPLLLERRAATLAQEIAVPIEALDLALANWGSGERATVGCPPDALDGDAERRAADALGL
jgi:Alpha-glutamyl/putrescinyl thymine pyrophosphorylase clade 3